MRLPWFLMLLVGVTALGCSRDAVRDKRAAREIERLQARPRGPIVVVTDYKTGQPVAGARVSARVVLLEGTRVAVLDALTDQTGCARLPTEPEDINNITVRADGYARNHASLSVKPGPKGKSERVRIAIGKPIVVEVVLVLPDDRRAAISVHEGSADEPAPPGLRDQLELEPRRLIAPVTWADPPPDLPQHNPLLRMNLAGGGLHAGVRGVIYRVTGARTVAGRDLPVFRTAPPPDPATFGLYEIGRNGLNDTVFVVGTLADARAVEAAAMTFQWTRNRRVLRGASRGATGEE